MIFQGPIIIKFSHLDCTLPKTFVATIFYTFWLYMKTYIKIKGKQLGYSTQMFPHGGLTTQFSNEEISEDMKPFQKAKISMRN